MSSAGGSGDAEMPCAVERAQSYKCMEKFQLKKLDPECQDEFDAYKRCRKKFIQGRNDKNMLMAGNASSSAAPPPQQLTGRNRVFEEED